MGIEIDLLNNYTKSKRNVKDRSAEKTENDQLIARQFGKQFFDGDRKHGYGGFHTIQGSGNRLYLHLRNTLI